MAFFVFQNLEAAQIRHPEEVSAKIKAAFVQFPNWQRSDNELRELRKKVTFAIFAECDQLEQVTPLVEGLFALLSKMNKNG